MNADWESESDILFANSELGGRFDVSAAAAFSISRSAAAAKIALGEILLDGEITKPAQPVRPGQTLSMLISPPAAVGPIPEDIPIDIVYQDADVCVVNKRQGMVVHPAAGNESGTLVNALMFHLGDLAGIGGELRPGIVHRIDKNTSGLLAVAKNTAAHISLAKQISSRSMKRTYTALVAGYPKPHGTIDAPVGRDPKNRKRMAIVPDGRAAVTHYDVLETFRGFSLVEARLDTGRTHQIRAHMRYIGHPIAGDALYGGTLALGLTAQALHAKELSFLHPSTGERMTFTAPLPDNFAACVERLRLENGDGRGE